jgi:cytochrome c6
VLAGIISRRTTTPLKFRTRSFRKLMKKIITLSLIALALAGFIAANGPNLESYQVVAAADAAATYKAKCAGCHGAEGKGTEGFTPNMTDAKWQAGHSTAVITKAINEGKGQMPGFKSSMNAADVKGMVAFIRGLAPKKAAPAAKKK